MGGAVTAMAALPSFVDGTIPDAADLNTVSTDVDALTQITSGAPAAAGRSSPPLARIFLNTAQTIATGTNTAVQWTSQDIDTDNLWTPNTSDHFECRTAGKYVLTTQIMWNGNSAGRRIVRIVIDDFALVGTKSFAAFAVPSTNAAPDFLVMKCRTYPIPLTVGQNVFVGVFHDVGSNLNLRGAPDPRLMFGGCWASLRWVAP